MIALTAGFALLCATGLAIVEWSKLHPPPVWLMTVLAGRMVALFIVAWGAAAVIHVLSAGRAGRGVLTCGFMIASALVSSLAYFGLTAQP
jgi:hypothetical protein